MDLSLESLKVILKAIKSDKSEKISVGSPKRILLASLANFIMMLSMDIFDFYFPGHIMRDFEILIFIIIFFTGLQITIINYRRINNNKKKLWNLIDKVDLIRTREIGKKLLILLIGFDLILLFLIHTNQFESFSIFGSDKILEIIMRSITVGLTTSIMLFMISLILEKISIDYLLLISKLYFSLYNSEERSFTIKNFIHGLICYDKFLRKYLGMQINNIHKVINQFILLPIEEQKNIIDNVIISIDNDKINVINILYKYFYTNENEILIKESIIQKLKNNIPIVVSIVTVTISIFNYFKP